MLTGVSVPLALLGLLEREPSHGYDLKRDYDAYFGRGKPLPFGQVYATLGRLARDGKVVAGLMLGRPAEGYLDTQRAAHVQRMRELTDLKRMGSLVDGLLADHGLFHLEADLRWIDVTQARLSALAEMVRTS